MGYLALGLFLSDCAEHFFICARPLFLDLLSLLPSFI